MKYVLQISLFISLMLSAASCQKDLEADFINHEPKLVVHTLLGEDSWQTQTNDTTATFRSAFLHIGRSASVYGADFPSGENQVDVKLYENGVFMEKLISPGNDTVFDSIVVERGYYRSYSEFTSGNTYEYRLEHAELGKASARFFLPYATKIASAVWYPSSDSITFSFKDLPGKDYYAFSINVHDSAQNVTHLNLHFETSDPEVQFFNSSPFDSSLIPIANDLENYGNVGYLNDNSFDGESKQISLKLWKWVPGSQTYFSPTAKLEVILYHLTPDFFKYQKSFSAYIGTENNPFAEKVQLHSNVENGYGMVGAKVPFKMIAIKK